MKILSVLKLYTILILELFKLWKKYVCVRANEYVRKNEDLKTK